MPKYSETSTKGQPDPAEQYGWINEFSGACKLRPEV